MWQVCRVFSIVVLTVSSADTELYWAYCALILSCSNLYWLLGYLGRTIGGLSDCEPRDLCCLAGIAPDEQTLTFPGIIGKKLEDERTLADYNILDSSHKLKLYTCEDIVDITHKLIFKDMEDEDVDSREDMKKVSVFWKFQ